MFIPYLKKQVNYIFLKKQQQQQQQQQPQQQT